MHSNNSSSISDINANERVTAQSFVCDGIAFVLENIDGVIKINTMRGYLAKQPIIFKASN